MTKTTAVVDNGGCEVQLPARHTMASWMATSASKSYLMTSSLLVVNVCKFCGLVLIYSCLEVNGSLKVRALSGPTFGRVGRERG